MRPETLGYSEKWIRFGLLDETSLQKQMEIFRNSADKNTEHYRYGSFLYWLRNKKVLTNSEISNYVELAKEDSNELMAGSAVKELLLAPQLTDEQFEYVKPLIPAFGEWTIKLIERETLKRAITKTGINEDLLHKSIRYRAAFSDNSLITLIIRSTDNIHFIQEFTKLTYGKKIRDLAHEQLKYINKSIK